jgi:CDP-glucose 4,6-dehydratase
VEWIWGYRESDHLGGKDVYSSSKGAAELTIKSYWNSFIKFMPNVKLGVARAGNVIGGGDWSVDRIVVDTVNAFSKGEKVEIRSPKATRPWQHVLEPLSGYLTLAQNLFDGSIENGEAFNFGPRAEQTKTVKQLVEDIATKWKIDPLKAVVVTDQIPFEEAKLLKLNCDKALAYLNWHSVLSYNQTVELITDWYLAYYNNSESLEDLTIKQIEFFEQEAKNQEQHWTK